MLRQGGKDRGWGQRHSKKRSKKYKFYLFRLCSFSNTIMQLLESLEQEFSNGDRNLGTGRVKSVNKGWDVEA